MLFWACSAVTSGMFSTAGALCIRDNIKDSNTSKSGGDIENVVFSSHRKNSNLHSINLNGVGLVRVYYF